MPRLEYFLVAESCAVDADTGRLSLFHVLESLQADRLPTGLLAAVAAGSVIREQGDDSQQELRAELHVSAPGSVSPTSFAMPVFLAEERTRLLFFVERIPLGAEGELKFTLELGGHHLASHTVPVRQRPQIEPTPKPGSAV